MPVRGILDVAVDGDGGQVDAVLEDVVSQGISRRREREAAEIGATHKSFFAKTGDLGGQADGC